MPKAASISITSGADISLLKASDQMADLAAHGCLKISSNHSVLEPDDLESMISQIEHAIDHPGSERPHRGDPGTDSGSRLTAKDQIVLDEVTALCRRVLAWG